MTRSQRHVYALVTGGCGRTRKPRRVYALVRGVDGMTPARRVHALVSSVELMMRPYRLMGILNVTPDSFSDGGRFLDAGAALAHARVLLDEGADIVDVGGESTRPGAEPVAAEEELRRVLPVIEGIAGHVRADRDSNARSGERPVVSIDTSKASVARAALAAGAEHRQRRQRLPRRPADGRRWWRTAALAAV